MENEGAGIDVEFETEEQGDTKLTDGVADDENDEEMDGEVDSETSESESDEDYPDEEDDDYEDYALNSEELVDDDDDLDSEDDGELQPRTASIPAERRVDLRYVRAASFQPVQTFAHPLVSETVRATHATTCAMGPEALTSSSISPTSKSPVSVHRMIHRREANLTGVGRFRKSDCRHIGLRHIPQHNPVVREDVNSRGYIGQYSENGEWFIAGFQDRRIKIYEVHNEWRMRKEIMARGLRWTITDTCMSPDRNFLVYSSITPIVHMVSTAPQYDCVANMEDDKEHFALHLGSAYDNFGVWGISFSPDGREIIAGTSSDRLIVYDVETNKTIVKINAHSDDVNSVAFIDEGSNLMVSGSDDALCKVWDRRTATPTPVGVFPGHTEGIAHVSPKGDGRYFISNSKDQSIKLWDLRGMRTNSTYNPQQKKIARYHWDYRWMEYPPFSKHDIAFKGHPDDASIMTYRGHAVLETLIRSYFSPLHTTGQRYIYSGSHDGRVYVYDLITGEVAALLMHHISIVRDCSWHPTEPKLVSCSWDGSIVEWSHDPREPVVCKRLEDLKRSVRLKLGGS